ALHIGDIGAAGGQHRELLIAEIGTDPAYHVDLIEERGGQREVRRGAAEHALALAERRLDRVVGQRADDRDAHVVVTWDMWGSDVVRKEPDVSGPGRLCCGHAYPGGDRRRRPGWAHAGPPARPGG